MQVHAMGEDGATAVEYSIMVAAIAAVIVAVVFVIGTQSCEMYETTSTNIAAARPEGPNAEDCG